VGEDLVEGYGVELGVAAVAVDAVDDEGLFAW
jgi:hypothetical protein